MLRSGRIRILRSHLKNIHKDFCDAYAGEERKVQFRRMYNDYLEEVRAMETAFYDRETENRVVTGIAFLLGKYGRPFSDGEGSSLKNAFKKA